jgi:hypothetical protein
MTQKGVLRVEIRNIVTTAQLEYHGIHAIRPHAPDHCCPIALDGAENSLMGT